MAFEHAIETGVEREVRRLNPGTSVLVIGTFSALSWGIVVSFIISLGSMF